MGKRKERRLAAKIGAGRRVKLDLFAEPSGDLGGTSAKDDDGKDVDGKHDLELPNSPSSSGQPPENPLSLLGQYSDDELDDGSNEAATFSNDDKQVKIASRESFEEGEIVDVEDHSSQMAHDLDVGKDSASASASPIAEADTSRSNFVSSDKKDNEAIMENNDIVPVASEAKISEGMSSIWKMVLHEESNRYYYWNTVSGETSWELPECLAQGDALPHELEILGTDMKVNAAPTAPAAFGVNLNDFSAGQGAGYSSAISDIKGIYEPGALANQSLEQSRVDGCQYMGGFSVVGALPYEASSVNYSLPAHLNASGGSLVAGSYEVHDQSAFTTEQGAVDLPSHLVKIGEALLEKLKFLQRSGVDSAEHGWLSKCMLEIEIRLSDIRCLLPYGLLLNLFWMHSERQLSLLENSINTEIENQKNKDSVLDVSTEGKEANMEAEGDANMRKLSSENFVANVHNDVSVMAQKAVHDEALHEGIPKVQQTSLKDPPVHQHSGNKGCEEIDKAAVSGKASLNSEFQPNEDVDMDIDMEVEDQSPARERVVDIDDQLVASPGQVLQTSAPMAEIPLTPENEFFIPPPPQEEWIPPPPPDEGIPPPPPDEPPESPCPPPPPSEPESMPPSTYNEQHNTTHIESSVNYYGNVVTASMGTGFYEHADASQIAALNPAFYAAALNAQSTPVLNPVDSTVYYGIHNGALPVVHVPTTAGSSTFQTASGHSNYEPLSAERVGIVDAGASVSSLPKQLKDPLVPGAEIDIAPTQISSTFVASAPATASMKEYASAPSYSATATSDSVTSTSAAVASDASAALAKVQSKASRMKKPKVSVTSSLRSNKKVSGLVDKWKAAKEELQEEEKEEYKTPLEMLEKKRQREIEGWRAQQIASGEAKENANFQPLGGDWRERVKRRRAQKKAAAGTASDDLDDGSKQPDLSELSRDLSPGWQAIWDDSSRQVYYANSITSETTWTRPAR